MIDRRPHPWVAVFFSPDSTISCQASKLNAAEKRIGLGRFGKHWTQMFGH